MKPAWLFPPLAGLLLGSASPPPPPTLDYAWFAEAAPGCGGQDDDDCEILVWVEAVPAQPAEPQASVPASARRGDRTVRPRWAGHGSGGRLRVVVSIPAQRAYVFDGERLLATSRVSTGRRGHETPVGTFRILAKAVKHRSNRYANAPMPYMQRLTSYGIALHAGHLPGYPASHGCIRLPWSFARQLYGLTDSATIVTVTNRRPRLAADALALS